MGREDDTTRYRVAAAAALQQVDSCIAYLHQMRQVQKRKLAAQLAKNRNLIARRLR